MKRINVIGISLMMVVSLGLIPLHGQTKDDGDIGFSCVLWQPLPYEEIFYLDGEEYKPLSLEIGTRSEMHPLSESQSLMLYSRAEVDGETAYQLIGEEALPSKSDRFLFLIGEANKTSSLPLHIIGLDDSIESFPRGTYKFINFAQVTLEVEISGKKSRVAPKSTEVVKPSIPEDGGFLPFYIRTAPNTVVYETRLFSQQSDRAMVLLFPSQGKRPISVKFLSNFVGAEKKAEEE